MSKVRRKNAEERKLALLGDSMIHLVFGVGAPSATDNKAGPRGWRGGRREQWRGIVYSDIIFAAGFAIFALSAFPPTQRLGLVVLAGLVIDLLANLFVLPLLGGAEWKRGRGGRPLSSVLRPPSSALSPPSSVL